MLFISIPRIFDLVWMSGRLFYIESEELISVLCEGGGMNKCPKKRRRNLYQVLVLMLSRLCGIFYVVNQLKILSKLHVHVENRLSVLT